jgi:hypothetical protein
MTTPDARRRPRPTDRFAGFYLAEAANGVRSFDYRKMLSTTLDFVVFNGRPHP